MVSESNEQHSQHHGIDDQDLPMIGGLVERQHRREKIRRRRRNTQKMAFGGGRPGDGRAPEVDSAVQEPNVG